MVIKRPNRYAQNNSTSAAPIAPYISLLLLS